MCRLLVLTKVTTFFPISQLVFTQLNSHFFIFLFFEEQSIEFVSDIGLFRVALFLRMRKTPLFMELLMVERLLRVGTSSRIRTRYLLIQWLSR